MKAITQYAYGTVDMLAYEDVPSPKPGPDEVMIRVHAAGVDPGVWHIMTGRPLIARAALGLRRPRETIRGWDVSGVVEAVGADVIRFKRGDAVFGTTGGSFAEYACAAESKFQPKPENLDFVAAAALPTSGMTALTGLREVGRVESGWNVLIIGASGGVGHLAVQLACHLGARVTGVCGGDSAEFVTSLGATRVIDYRRETLTGTYDFILDMAGNRPIPELRALLTPTGTLVIGGGEGDGRWFGGTGRTARAQLISPFVRHRLAGLLSLPKPETLREVAELAASGAWAPRIDRTFALSDAPAAIDYLVSGHPRGKIALVVA
ncbi:NAD(P)-dependent alcohol dehydrogenase [Nocardia sp. NPDC058058]|uniref:NAD(P)-dependent alcohol dehydrogenase n=1 Tax=Nocardia sp. NPDC058058 TaxID=3346317 RepID=UPI0036D8864C